MARFAEVCVTLPVAGRFHYGVPPELAGRVAVGQRVLVRFGPRKVTGVIVRLDSEPPVGVVPVLLSELLDDAPALSGELVELCMWIADYYEAPPGEVIRAALPAGSGVAARVAYVVTAAGQGIVDGHGAAMPARPRALLDRLGKLGGRGLPVAGLAAGVKQQLEQLRAQGLVEQREQRDAARVRLKRERIATLIGTPDAARAAVARAPKRLAVIERLARADSRGGEAIAGGGAAIAGGGAVISLSRAAIAAKGEANAAGGKASAAGGGEANAAGGSAANAAGGSAANAAGGGEASAAGGGEANAAKGEANAAGGGEANAAGGGEATATGGSEANAAGGGKASAAGGGEANAAGGGEANAAGGGETIAGSGEANAAGGGEAIAGSGEASAAGLAIDELEREVPNAKATLRELVKLGLVRVSERELPLDAARTGDGLQVAPPPVLTAEQVVAVDAIVAGLGDAASERPAAFLLHGVTGSGKTEVYLRVIARVLEAGQTALVLVPEISLTPQLAARFRARFGDRVAILHSGLSESARLGEWSRLARGEARIAVGARSAVFAPLRGLGAIVVDEEHDGSFKQDEGVRYHARDVALVRAQRAGAVCVLGSATPSLESAAHAERGTYRKLTLTERPTARPMPSVEIIDLRTYLPDGEAMLSAPLRAAIGETLAAGDQTILFLNRRGFATFVLCRACGHAFRCPHCSVSLTYHRHSDRLSCHYCGFQQRVPDVCPKCGGKDTIERKGLGTEKVADAIATGFPAARVARLDRDVATGARIEAVLARVARREVDVLVGTQMVTKGHDFPGVTLVGVLCADTGLNLPDFRASERTFQLLAQVAGRAGRGDRPGRVIVQTYRPESPAVVAAAAHDYAQFFTAESAARAELGYPPHGRLIAVRIDGADGHAVAAVAQQLAQLAEAAAARPEAAGQVEVRGPVPAPLERLRNRTRWQIWLRGADRHALRRVARSLLAAEVPSAIRVGLDVDPISAM